MTRDDEPDYNLNSNQRLPRTYPSVRLSSRPDHLLVRS